MTDRELLEAAAKAAEIKIHESDDGTIQRRPVWATPHYVQGQPYGEHRWDPLHDDGQALRLAVKLGLEVYHSINNDRWMVFVGYPKGQRITYEMEEYGDDEYAATRRAIVRAAAAMAG